MMSLSSLSLPTLSLALLLTAACSRSDTVSTRSDAARMNSNGDADVTSSSPTGPGGVNGATANGSGPTRLNPDANAAGPGRTDPGQVTTAVPPTVGLGDTTYVDSMVGGGMVKPPAPGVAGAPPGGGVGSGPSFNDRNDGASVAGVAPTVTPTAPVVGTSQSPAPASAPGQSGTNGPINRGNGPGTISGARNQADGPGTVLPGGSPDNRPGMDPSNPASPVAPPAGVVPMR